MQYYDSIQGKKDMTRFTVFVTLLPLVATLCGCGARSPEGELKKGMAEFNRKNYSESIASLNRASEQIKDSDLLYYTLGVAYLHLGDMDKALDALNRAVDITPAHCEALICLGQIAYHKTEFDYSRKCYETALKLAPEPKVKAVLYTSLALTESGLKNNGLARLYLIRALSSDGTYAPAMYNLGSLYRDKYGFNEEALGYFREYLRNADKSDPHYEKARNNVTRLEKVVERASAAPAAGRNAVAAAKALEEAVVFQAEKKYREAIRSYDAALKADPRVFSAAYGRAMAFQRMNNATEALGAFKQALALNPDHQDSYARAAEIALGLKRFTEAAALLDRAIARNPRYVSWYDLMARVLYGQERYRDALQYGEYYLSLMKPGDAERAAYEQWVKALREAE